MDFLDLIGCEYTETELYESVLFQVEENFGYYFTKHMHLYFERVSQNVIRITHVLQFQSEEELQQRSRQIIEKREWFEVTRNFDHINLLFCRLDRSGLASSVWKDQPSETYNWCHGWADEIPYNGPMTQQEIHQVLQELRGLLVRSQSSTLLRSKKSV